MFFSIRCAKEQSATHIDRCADEKPVYSDLVVGKHVVRICVSFCTACAPGHEVTVMHLRCNCIIECFCTHHS